MSAVKVFRDSSLYQRGARGDLQFDCINIQLRKNKSPSISTLAPALFYLVHPWTRPFYKGGGSENPMSCINLIKAAVAHGTTYKNILPTCRRSDVIRQVKYIVGRRHIACALRKFLGLLLLLCRRRIASILRRAYRQTTCPTFGHAENNSVVVSIFALLISLQAVIRIGIEQG